MKSKVKKLGGGESRKEYDKIIETMNFNPDSTHKFISDGLHKLENTNLRGNVLELFVCETLKRLEITPFYHQVRVDKIPDTEFDIVCYHPVYPVVLSCKASLRERYKQAAYEGCNFKNVYRNAKCYLITVDKSEAVKLKKKIEKGKVLGIDGCYLADHKEFSDFLIDLKNQYEFSVAKQINPITKGKLIQKNKSSGKVKPAS
ncbi:MAG: hypothetical protein OXH90_05020 [Paracoccaceae bacterium]|nr:hypothetical protein [Paracoccaceae bacterium]MDE2917030.1 hypothetical protein [Paracoccaceae bacterium]